MVITATATIARSTPSEVTAREPVPCRTQIHRVEPVPHEARCAGDILAFAGRLSERRGHIGGAYVGTRARLVLIPTTEAARIGVHREAIEAQRACHIKGEHTASATVPRWADKVGGERQVGILWHTHHLKTLLCGRGSTVLVGICIYGSTSCSTCSEGECTSGERHAIGGYQVLIPAGVVQRGESCAAQRIRTTGRIVAAIEVAVRRADIRILHLDDQDQITGSDGNASEAVPRGVRGGHSTQHERCSPNRNVLVPVDRKVGIDHCCGVRRTIRSRRTANGHLCAGSGKGQKEQQSGK